MKFHLMIVDDEAPIRKGLSSFIDWAAIDCHVEATASDGAEAIELLKQHQIDIIITDIKMPEADGIAVAKHVFEHCPHIMVIILTGYADFHYAQTAIRYNVVNFLLKPTSKAELIRAVQSAQEKILTSNTRSAMAEEDMAFLKEQLLQELTDGQTDAALTARLESYEINLDCYCIAAFQLQEPSDALAVLKEIITGQHNSYCYRYNHLILAVYSVDSCCRETPDAVRERCAEILDFAASLYAMDISIGISSPHTGSQMLPSAASEAIYALTQNFYSGKKIGCYESSRNPSAYTLTAEDTLCLYEIENSLNNWQFTAASAQIGSMFTRLTSNFAKSADVKSICSQLYYICSRVLLKKELQPPDTAYLTRIHDSRAIGNLEGIIREILTFLEQSLVHSGKQYSPMVEGAIQFIHQNLSEALSLEMIAGQVHVNPSHLSRTFKKECGQPLTDYVNSIRIEKAKELLAAPNALAYQVSEQTGFHDPAYFSAIFKRYTGYSPTEYRQKALGMPK